MLCAGTFSHPERNPVLLGSPSLTPTQMPATVTPLPECTTLRVRDASHGGPRTRDLGAAAPHSPCPGPPTLGQVSVPSPCTHGDRHSTAWPDQLAYCHVLRVIGVQALQMGLLAQVSVWGHLPLLGRHREPSCQGATGRLPTGTACCWYAAGTRPHCQPLRLHHHEMSLPRTGGNASCSHRRCAASVVSSHLHTAAGGGTPGPCVQGGGGPAGLAVGPWGQFLGPTAWRVVSLASRAPGPGWET